MKKIVLGALVALAFLVTSCNVQERIVFNEHMGGTYQSSFDMSSMMAIANQGRPAAAQEGKELKKMDTTIVFKDIIEQYKDSIATLSPEKQEQLDRVKDMTMHMVMDEANNVFRFDADKAFQSFNEIAFVSYEMDEIFNIAKDMGKDPNTPPSPADEMLKSDRVQYTFENNVFRRVDPVKLAEEEAALNGITKDAEVTPETSEDSMAGMMDEAMAQFEDMLASSKMILEYTFPRKVKSISHEGAVISEDGMTVTYAVDWKTMMDDKKLLENFEVVLEEE